MDCAAIRVGLTILLNPTSGTGRLADLDVVESRERLRGCIGDHMTPFLSLRTPDNLNRPVPNPATTKLGTTRPVVLKIKQPRTAHLVA